MKRIKILFLLVMSVQVVFSQVMTEYAIEKALPLPRTFQIISSKSRTYKMETFDVEKFINEDKNLEGIDIPYRFGKGFDTSFSFEDGNWSDVEGGRLWTISFESEGALSLNFIFENFTLPKGATLHIINQEQTVCYGPVTLEAIPEDGHFMTDIIPGSNVTFYLFEPSEHISESSLIIKKVVHGYRSFPYANGENTRGNAESCNIDIVCYPEYADEAKAVALVLLANGDELCSGSLLMTTDLSFKPYFLTAFHCLDLNQNGTLSDSEISASQNWMFKFNYRRQSCNGNTVTTGYTYNAATFRAAWSNTDFALMEINHNLRQYENRHFWLGWDRSGNIPINGAGIHHPAGDVMKISISDSPFVSSYWNNNINNTHWKVTWDEGITQGGSSGSPLLDQNKRVVGQVHGKLGIDIPYNSTLCDRLVTRYGKFNLSWTGGGTNSTRLSNWLDPINSGAIQTNSSFISIIPTLSAPSAICTTATAQILDFPTDCTVNWSVSNSCMQIISGQGTDSVTLQRNDDGWATLTATISYNGTVVKTLSKEIMVGTPAFCMSVIPVAADGSQGYWRSDLNGNAIDVEFVNSNARYPNYVVDLYRIDNGFSVGTHLGHWVTPSLSDMTFNYYPQGWYYIEVVGVNDCGTSEAWGTELECVDGNDLQNRMFSFVYDQSSAMLTVTLNPASERSQKLSQKQVLNEPASAGSYEVQLWSENTLLRSYKATDAQLQIPMSGMKAGLYVVCAVKDGKTQQRKLIKK